MKTNALLKGMAIVVALLVSSPVARARNLDDKTNPVLEWNQIFIDTLNASSPRQVLHRPDNYLLPG